ncbi:MAG: hypothetical protein M0R74_03240 [Dehalococcoidia bacterium]|nr:hypothetical protein [Dehalococcoidia bacterium]
MATRWLLRLSDVNEKALRLTKVPQAALQLEAAWADELHVLVERSEMDQEVKVSRPDIRRSPDDPNRYAVRLRVRYVDPDFRITVAARGVFSLDPTQEEPQRLLQYNAPAILYGLIRGWVMLMTGGASVRRVELPAVNLAERIERG